jgi:hypothetical protein
MYVSTSLTCGGFSCPLATFAEEWGQYSPDRCPIPSEHSGHGFEIVIRQKWGKEALSASQDFFAHNP